MQKYNNPEWDSVCNTIIAKYSPVFYNRGSKGSLHLQLSSNADAKRISSELWKLGYVAQKRIVNSKKSPSRFWVDVYPPTQSILDVDDVRVVGGPEREGDSLIKNLKKSTPDIKFPSVGLFRLERNPITCLCQVWYNAGGMDSGIITCSEDELGVVLEDLYDDGLKNEMQIPFRRKSKDKKPEREVKQVDVNLENYRTLVVSYVEGKPRNAVMPEIIKPQPKPEQPKSNPKPRFVVEVWDGTRGKF